MAAMYALPGTAFKTDCQAAFRVFIGGATVAVAGRQCYACIWASVFAKLEDYRQEKDFQSMPARTKVSNVGSATLSDSTFLWHVDRYANDLADQFAKSAAKANGVTLPVRNRLTADQARARHLALWIMLSPHGNAVRDSRPVPRAGREPSNVRGTCARVLQRRTRDLRVSCPRRFAGPLHARNGPRRFGAAASASQARSSCSDGRSLFPGLVYASLSLVWIV